MATFKNLDKDGDGKVDHFVVEIRNDIGSGSARLKEMSIDGVAIPVDKIDLTVGNRPSRKFDPTTEIYSEYGDIIKIEVEKKGGLKKGDHSLGVKAGIDWEEQTISFKGTI